MQSIPQVLIDNIKKKNVVLFIGSGFAYKAEHPNHEKAPLGKELAIKISDRFLNGQYQESTLTYISDLAISQSSLFDVQSFIYELFIKFTANADQVKFSNFSWKSIFTTNYDTILEDAYKKNTTAPQDLSVVYRNTREQDIFKSDKSVPYFKLHGCVSYINDKDLPLILSSEQYLSHKKNRERLFEKFRTLANDYTVLFIGYSNQDHNIRAILQELEILKDGRPRSYMVSPDFTDIETQYWTERKISCLKMTYSEFINELSTKITEEERKLSSIIPDSSRLIYEKFVLNPKEILPTQSLIKLLDFEVDYVHSAIASQTTTPQAFYKGYFENWDPIIKNLDVDRNLKDRILSDILFEEKFNSENSSNFVCITGFAGSGKSVLLRRLSWEASVTFEKVCIYLRKNTFIRSEPIIELYNFIKDRIYLFIDDIIYNDQGIIYLLDKLEKENIPVTIIGTASTNQLNDHKEIESYLDKKYKLTYLSEKEIDNLLDKLALHKSLGYLENKSREQQQKELSEQSGRVLLVALHEATGGKNFEEIIFNEYKSILKPEAKSLYLTVAILHNLGSYARAGLISRVHNIGFIEFEREFFKPLEYIVFSEKNYTISDYIYKTRHPLIAQMIFNTVLVDQQDRYDEYIRILNYLDIDYNSDKSAFLSMTKAKSLISMFSDPIKVRNLYDAAEKCSPNNGKLLQQRAIYEMTISGGDNDKAEKLLKEALELEPDNVLISHSLAENYLKKAERSQHYIEKNKLIQNAQELSKEIIRKSPSHPHSHHTILKSKLYQLKDELKIDNKNSIEALIKDIEKTLELTKQRFPEQEFILDIEAKFRQTIEQEPSALQILEHAYKLNMASPYIALRYAKTLEDFGDITKAFEILDKTISLSPNEKDISFKYAMLMAKLKPNELQTISNYFRRSFTLGDNRYEAQFWYAVSLFLLNQSDVSLAQFEKLSKAKIDPEFKKQPRTLDIPDALKSFNGIVKKIEFNHGYILREAYSDRIFFNKTKNPKWNKIKTDSKYKFKLLFNYYGPIAVEIC